jgi:ribonuclease E
MMTMTKKMLIDATHPEETRVALVSQNKLEDYDFESIARKQIKSNIYLVKVTRVEPSLQAAFVDFGGNRHGFLPFPEIHHDYYRIPIADREAILAEEKALAEAQAKADEERDAREAAALGISFDEIDINDISESAESDEGVVALIEEVESDDEFEEGEGDEGESLFAEDEEGDEMPESPHEKHESAGLNEEQNRVVEGADAEEASAPSHKAQGRKQGGRKQAAEGAEVEGARAEDLTAVGEEEILGADLGEAEGDAEAGAIEVTDGAEGDASAPRRERGGRGRGRFQRGGRGRGRGGRDRQHEQNADGESQSQHLGEDDFEERGSDNDLARFRSSLKRRYKIQEVIKRGQIMLIQISKEERGNKGAAVTTYISLPGRYCVLMPNSPRGGGVSRKVSNLKDRQRLKKILVELDVPEGMSVILRTAGVSRSFEEIRRDLDNLLRMWDNIREKTLQSTAPTLVYEEGSLIKRAVRDLYKRDIDEVWVEGKAGYEQARDFMSVLMPSHVERVHLYEDKDVPLFNRYQVENQIDAIHSPVVQLKSGGYIVINPTEALVSIDVNSGRATKGRHIEETALKTNLEAAEEIARQLRLRDLGGLVVIDFIDMEDRRNNRTVERKLKEAMSQDRARIQLGRISLFGLLELSRQRMNPSLVETNFQTCPHCKGTGLVRTVETSAVIILRSIAEEGMKGRAAVVKVTTHPSVAIYIMNNKREMLIDIEKRHQMRVEFASDEHLISPDHKIEMVRSKGDEARFNREQERHVRRGAVPIRQGMVGEAEGAHPYHTHDAEEGEMGGEEMNFDGASSEGFDGGAVIVEDGRADHRGFKRGGRDRNGRDRGGRGGRDRGGRDRNGRGQRHFDETQRPSYSGDDMTLADGAVLEQAGDFAPTPGVERQLHDEQGSRSQGERHERGGRDRGRNRGRDRGGRERGGRDRGERFEKREGGENGAPVTQEVADFTPRPILDIPIREVKKTDGQNQGKAEPVLADKAVSESASSEAAPRRKGWWKRVLSSDDKTS